MNWILNKQHYKKINKQHYNNKKERNHMEKIIYENKDVVLKYVEDEDITSIDYEIILNDRGYFMAGDFIFNKEEVMKVYNCFDVDGLISYCRTIISKELGVKENWEKIARDFKSHGVVINADEYEGFDD